MHSFKKVFSVSIIYFICIFFVSWILISTFVNSESKPYLDRNYRNELKYSLDCLVIGSSGGAFGFRPMVFNNETGHNCYNLCGNSISGKGKIRLLKEEIYRNDINTVIATIEVDELGFDVKKKGRR